MDGDDFGEFESWVSVSSNSHLHKHYENYENLSLKTFDFTEHKLHEMENNIDPENNFFNNINCSCKYYTDEQFKSNIIMDGTLPIIHFNNRSLYKKFH